MPFNTPNFSSVNSNSSLLHDIPVAEMANVFDDVALFSASDPLNYLSLVSPVSYLTACVLNNTINISLLYSAVAHLYSLDLTEFYLSYGFKPLPNADVSLSTYNIGVRDDISINYIMLGGKKGKAKVEREAKEIINTAVKMNKKVQAKKPNNQSNKIRGSGTYTRPVETVNKVYKPKRPTISGSGNYFEDIGSDLGKFAGKTLGSIFGMGDYRTVRESNSHLFGDKIKCNSLFDSNGGLAFAKRRVPDGATRAYGKEEIGNVLSSVGFATTTYRINFGNQAVFPEAYLDGERYEETHFHGLIAIFESSAAEVSTSTNIGNVYMCAQYDLEEPPFTTSKQLLNSFAPTSSKSDQGGMHGFECAREQSKRQLLINQDNINVVDKDKINDYDLCNFTIATEGQSADGLVIGKLYIMYDVDLYKKRVPETDTFEQYFDPAGAPDGAFWFQSAATHTMTNPDPCTSLLTDHQLAFLKTGRYFVYATRAFSGTISGSITPSVIADSNMAILSAAPGWGGGYESGITNIQTPSASSQVFLRIVVDVLNLPSKLIASFGASLSGSWLGGDTRIFKISSSTPTKTGIVDPVSSSLMLKQQLYYLNNNFLLLQKQLLPVVSESKNAYNNNNVNSVNSIHSVDDFEEIPSEESDDVSLVKENLALKKRIYQLVVEKQAAEMPQKACVLSTR